MDFIEKLLTVYWPQTTLLLVAVGYPIKRALDNKSKKIEINYTIFQQRRLEALQRFILAYSNIEQVWRVLNIDEIASRSITAKEIDNMIEPPLKEMKSSVLELQVYLDNKDFVLFEQILFNTNIYQSLLSNLYYNYETDKTHYQKLMNFRKESEPYLIRNKELIGKVNDIVKKTFS